MPPVDAVYTQQDVEGFDKARDTLSCAETDACLLSAMPPLFAMPEKMVHQIAEESGNEKLPDLWKHSLALFRRNIKKQRLSITLLDPKLTVLTPEFLCPLVVGSEATGVRSYTKEQYALHIDRLRQLEKRYENLQVRFRSDVVNNTALYVKADTGVIMAKIDAPMSAFVISDQSMVSAFWDYISGLFR